MIGGDKSLGSIAASGGTKIGPDGVIQQGKPSGPPHEGSRETHEGRIVSVPPDVCLTPRGAAMVPVPYKIWAYQREATNLANTVRQTSLRSHVKDSLILKCYGDEAGTGGGIKSGTHNAECTPKTWSQTVRFEARNAVRDSDEWWMNHKNTWGLLDYKKDMGQYATDDPQTIEPKMWLASAGGSCPALPSPSSPAVQNALNQFGLDPNDANNVAGAQAYAQMQKQLAGPNGSQMNNSQKENISRSVMNTEMQDPGTMSRYYNGDSAAEKRLNDAINQGLDDSLSKSQTKVKGKKKAKALTRAEIVRITLAQKKCPCTVEKYSEMIKRCSVECPESQAHHIVADYMLRFLSRKKARTSRIYTQDGTPLTSLNDGPAMCLIGDAAIKGTPHNTAQQWPAETIGKAAGAGGTVPLGYATDISVLGAIAARPECTAQILKKTYGAFDMFNRDTPVRGTTNTPSNDARKGLNGPPTTPGAPK